MDDRKWITHTGEGGRGVMLTGDVSTDVLMLTGDVLQFYASTAPGLLSTGTRPLSTMSLASQSVSDRATNNGIVK